MRPVIFGLLWSFATLAAGYDAYYAWTHQTGFEIWELNPFICWLASIGGLEAVFGFKIVTTVFAAGLALLCRWRRHWMEMPLTLTVAGIFFCLSIYYVISFKTPDPTYHSHEGQVVAMQIEKRPAVRAFMRRHWGTVNSKDSLRS